MKVKQLNWPGLLKAGLATTFFAFVFLPADAQNNSVKRVTAKINKPQKRENQQDNMDKAMKWEWELTHDPSTGTIPRERMAAARQYQMERLADMQSMAAVAGVNWTERGPNNVGGRTRGLIYDLNDATRRKVWATAASGGLWSCADITAVTPVWTKANDFLPNLAVNSIAQHPTTPLVMYAGTGEGWFNIDAQRGAGIYKTTNGGTTWAQLASTNNSAFFFVQKIVVTSASTVIACTHNGVRRSTDGGTTWTLVLGSGVGGSASARAADIEIGANGTIYCSMGIFNADGIYRSTNDGVTWTKIYTAAADEGRIEIATAPSNLNVVYAMLQDLNGPDNVSGTADDNRIKKLMLSSNSTAAVPTWATLGNPAYSRTDTGKLTLSNEEWKKILPADVYNIARQKGTEWAFTGKYWNTKDVGTYYCAACGNALFKSDTKFESGCGWPSFYDPISKTSVLYAPDNSHGMERTEVTCGRCKAHLGHVFEDGPPPTGLRYCINSVILDFEKAKVAEKKYEEKKDAPRQ